MQYDELKTLLEAHGQMHVLRWWDELDAAGREKLAGQIESIDWETVSLSHIGENGGRGKIEPIEGLSLEEIEARRAEYSAVGQEAIVKGKVAAVLLAGGQGTRLGLDGPKGACDIGITKPLYIFEQLIRNLQDVTNACGAYVPLLIMTSDLNDGATRAFFEEHNYFGYPAKEVFFFRQEMAPAVDEQGKLLMSAKDSLALSPNGNGGWYTSLERAGLVKKMAARGVEWFNVFAVDNVLQRIADPVFVGATIASGKASGAKFVRKGYPEERVGVLCLENGLPTVIEYYELSDEMENLRDGAGRLVYAFGVTLNYLFRLDVLQEIVSQRLPVHAAHKKVPCLDESGALVTPERENGYKFETLILDMVREAGSCLPFEVVREHEFAPIKNKVGKDSVESARELLKRNGVQL